MQISFFPWLSLKQSIGLEPFTFVPFKDAHGAVSEVLTGLAESLEVILESYVDMHGNPIGNCVVVTRSGRDPVWNIQDEDHYFISRCAQILAVAAISNNDYNSNFVCYANSTTFQFYGQRFQAPVDFIAFASRRRDGSTTDMGYLHGEVKFPVPPQAK